MSQSAVAERICHLPLEYERGDRSTATLVKEAGVVDAPEALVLAEIENVLKQEPKLLEVWLKRGNDQRIAGGWVIDCEDGQYRLKSFETGRITLIADKFHAGAEFIARYINRIGEVVRKYERRR